MPRFEVYQINFSDAEVREINEGSDTPEYFTRYLRATTFPEDAKPILEAADLYRLAAVIEAKDLEDLFRVGNIGPAQQICRLGPFHSLSVGDIVIDEESRASFVKSFGYGAVQLPDLLERGFHEDPQNL